MFPAELSVRRIIALIAVLAASQALACDATTPCKVAHGDYFVRAPTGWDGRGKLPVAIFFHGYMSSAREVMADRALGEALSRAGVLLVAPDGRRGSWSEAPGLSTGRDDVAFTREVVADVRRRFPVDDRLLVATGFSAGGFMVWRLACEAGRLFSAYAPIAGAFLDPIPMTCPTGPVSLRHVHGLDDEVVPMTGRFIAGGRVRTSDVRASIARLREIDSCPKRPSRVERRGDLECDVWSAAECGSGREIQLCLQRDGHKYDPRWIVEALHWAARLPSP